MDLGHVRVNLRRTTDGVLLQGWVVGERDVNFLVSIATEASVSPGDAFVCEVFSVEWTVTSLAIARFVSPCSISEDGEPEITIALEQVRTVSVSRGKGNERVLVQGLTAALWGEGGRIAQACPIQDVSRQGLSVIAAQGIDQETPVNVVVEGHGAALNFASTVRYCKPTKQGFKIGLHISAADRVTLARWAQIVNDGRNLAADAA